MQQPTRPDRLGHLPGYEIIPGRVLLTSPWVAGHCDSVIAANGYTHRISLAPQVRSDVIRDDEAVEQAYMEEGLTIATIHRAVRSVTTTLAQGGRLVIGGAEPGEAETIASCLLASIERLPARVAYFALMKLACEAPRKSTQTDPPTRPTIDQGALRQFVQQHVELQERDAAPILARARRATRGDIEGPFEDLDWLIDGPHDEEARNLQLDLARALAAQTSIFSRGWWNWRAQRAFDEHRRAGTDGEIIQDALTFARPALFDELEAKRPLSPAEHSIAAIAWFDHARSWGTPDRDGSYRRALEHFEQLPAADVGSGHTLCAWALTIKATSNAVQDLKRATVLLDQIDRHDGHYFAAAEMLAELTEKLHGPHAEETFERYAEATWVNTVFPSTQGPAVWLSRTARDRDHPRALEALRTLWRICLLSPDRNVIQPTIDAIGGGLMEEPPRHQRELLEDMALSIASTLPDNADKRDALTAALHHRRMRLNGAADKDAAVADLRAQIKRLPGHPTCSIGVSQRDWE